MEAKISQITEVWAPNLEAEMRNIRDLVDKYNYIAMDTEFPGVVARPIGTFKTSSDYHYQTMRCNVDLLKIIQVGITLADEEGNTPEEGGTWQFNFRFSVSDDIYSPDSIDHLQKCGFDFGQHESIGILPNDFAELMITSGLVLEEGVKWIGFHSGYDFGYFVSLLTASSLPTTEDEFFGLLRKWFPTVYDLKYLMKSNNVVKGSGGNAGIQVKGGLAELGDELGIPRPTTNPSTGTDSLLTSQALFKLRQKYLNDAIDDNEFSGKLYGLGQTFNQNGVNGHGGLGGTGMGMGVTIAEREDRGSALTSNAREGHSHGGAMGHGQQVGSGQNHTSVGMGMGALGSAGMQAAGVGFGMNGPYGMRVGGR